MFLCFVSIVLTSFFVNFTIAFSKDVYSFSAIGYVLTAVEEFLEILVSLDLLMKDKSPMKVFLLFEFEVILLSKRFVDLL